jgi:hypothetical protein
MCCSFRGVGCTPWEPRNAVAVGSIDVYRFLENVETAGTLSSTVGLWGCAMAGTGLLSRWTEPGIDRPRASYRDDLVTALLGTWFLFGLFLDAWAHNNVPNLETFFTPWHAVFYTGFLATAGWICWLVWRNAAGGPVTGAAIPRGYGLGVLGLPAFALAGVADYTWHTVFGIEQQLKILFSPSHLGLALSMVLIITSPLRSAWANPGPATLRRLLPAVLSVAGATSLILLFLQYGNALAWGARGIVYSLSDDNGAVQLVSAIAITNAVLLGPLLLLAARWQPPAGVATIIYGVAACLAAAITGLESPAVIAGAVVAGLAVDTALYRLRPGPGRRGAMFAFGALAPFLTWALYLGFASAAIGQLPAIVEYWTGIPVVAAGLGLALTALATAGQSRPAE